MEKKPMSKDMGREDLLQELAYLYQAEYINKQAYAQLVKIVEEHFAQSYHPSAFGNNKSPKPHTPQAEQKIRNRPEEYITRDDIAMYGSVENAQIAKAEQSPEPGVDVELLEIQSNMRLWALSQCNHAYKMLDKAEELTCDDCLMQIVDEIIKQLLQQKPQAGQVDEELMRWLEDAYKYGDGFVPTKTYNQFKQLLTRQKRAVTREMAINVLTDIIDLHSEEGTGWEPLFDRLKELGIKVEEK